MAEKRFYAWIGVLAVLLLAGIYAIVRVFAEGHEILGTSEHIPWGILISTYVFFVVTSTGLCIVSSFGHVFGIKRYEMLSKKMVMLAIITLLAGFIAIGMELGHPLRLFIYAVVSPNFSSAIWWMGFLYTLYLVFMVLEFIFLDRHSMKMAQIAGTLGLISAISAHSTLGAIFGLVDVRPLYYGAVMPVFFILSAILSGAALILFIVLLERRVLKEEMPADMQSLIAEMGKLLGVVIGITLFFEFWKNTVGIYSPALEKATIYWYTLFGPLSFHYMGIAVFIGLIVPLGILLFRSTRTMNGILAASALVLIGIFVARYVLTIGGQTVPVYPGQWAPMLATYSPTGVEYLIVIFTMAFTALAYAIGNRIFKLEEHPAAPA